MNSENIALPEGHLQAGDVMMLLANRAGVHLLFVDQFEEGAVVGIRSEKVHPKSASLRCVE